MSEIYRIRTSKQLTAAATSTHNVEYFQDAESLAKGIMRTKLDYDAHEKYQHERPLQRFLADWWAQFLDVYSLRGKERPEYPYVIAFSVERHVTDPGTGEGAWVDVDWGYTSPSVRIDGRVIQ